MKNSKTKISLLNFSALLLIIIMLFPSAFQFAHAFEDHEQSKCAETTTHIHELEVECSVCDFKLNKNYYLLKQDFQVKVLPIQKKINKELYNFKYYHQQLSYSLRGPPELLT